MSARKMDLESVILEAAKGDDDRLDSLLREALKTMDEEQVLRLFDKVEQIVHEATHNAHEWKDCIQEGEV